MPDVSLISEMADKHHLGRLLQLMLGVAVNCPGKQSMFIAKVNILELCQKTSFC